MISDQQPERATAPQREDARDLVARLCRELGVAAVADALSAPAPECMAVQDHAPAQPLDLAA